MVEVLIEFDYTAQEPDELSIKKGDIIKDCTPKCDGWYQGTLNGKKGVFPDNFGKVLPKDDVVLRNKKDSTRIRQCRVVFSYDQDHEDELSLKVGEVIDIVGEEEEGWWRGLLNGKEGVFPSNFVEEIVPPPSRPQATVREDLLRLNEPVPALPAKPVKQQCEVIFSYKAQNEDELTLKEGEIVTVLSKDCADAGWWKGELHGKVGVFPDNFVAMLLSGDDKKSSLKAGSKLHADTSAMTKPSSTAQRKSLNEPKSKLADAKVTPPLPGKKPAISLIKSPSNSGGSIFSKLKDKIVDAVDGATGSKPNTKENNNSDSSSNLNDLNAFDEVARRPLLNDVRANRARAPGRRLPKSGPMKDDEDLLSSIPNGNIEYPKSEYSVKSEDSFKSEGSASSETLDTSSDLDGELKPKKREWQKSRVPWLAEMKLNQAKRTLVSPPSEPPKSKPPQQTEPDLTPSKSTQNSPAEKEVNIDSMSKSMSDIKMETKPIPKVNKGEERAPPIKSKPVVTSSVSNRHSIGAMLPTRESPSRTPPQLKVSPKPVKTEQYENVSMHKSFMSSYTTSSSSSEKISSELKSSSSESTTVKLSDVLERLVNLEATVARQETTIEELRNKLQVESELRMMLQEKMAQNNVQV